MGPHTSFDLENERGRRIARRAASGGIYALEGRRHRTDVERTIFALVANRAIGPGLEAGRGRVGDERRGIPGLDGIDSDSAYRAMDVLASADAQGAVQEAVFWVSPTS